MNLIQQCQELSKLLEEQSETSYKSPLSQESIDLIIKTLNILSAPEDSVTIDAFQSFAFRSMVYVMRRHDMFEKERKKVVYALCNLTNLPWLMKVNQTGNAFVYQATDFLVNMIYSPEDDPITLGIEVLIPAYIMQLPSEKIKTHISKLCNPLRDAKETDQQFNPHTAAAITHCLVEIHSLNPFVVSDQFSSLVQTLLNTLQFLVSRRDYESIPPLIYQLFSLTKALPTNDCVKVLRGVATLLEILHRHHHYESERNTDHRNDIPHWTISTSLSHLGTSLRNNPVLPPVLLDLLRGKYISMSSPEENCIHGLRYESVSPTLLAMGITLSSSVPRMKRSVLDAVCSWVLDEELVRVKRHSSKWINGSLALMTKKTDMIDSNGKWKDDIDENVVWKDIDEYRYDAEGVDFGIKSIVLKCIKDLLLLADSGKDKARQGGGEFSSIYPFLESVGFLLIDAVKKDTVEDDILLTGAYRLPPLPNCNSRAIFNNANSSVKRANINMALIGRSLLVLLFTRAGKEEDETFVDGFSGNNAASHPLCRSIIQTSCSKFCGMSLNAAQHSQLFLDLVCSEEVANQSTTSNYGIAAHMLEESFLPMIIDLLSNIQSGSIPSNVVLKSIIPTLRNLLMICAQKSLRNKRRRSEYNDHIDHLFLLSKKALFCTDIERRKVAVNLLVLIMDVARRHPDLSKRDALIDEVTGYIKRCITQHQNQVRNEAYFALVGVLDPYSPTESISKGTDEKVKELDVIVTAILTAQLERYITLDEDTAVIDARRKRSIQHGTHLSQMDSDGDDHNANNQKCPLRLDLCTIQNRYFLSESTQIKSQTKKNRVLIPILSNAICCISEPLPCLIVALIAALRCGNKYDQGSSYDVLSSLQNKIAESSLESYFETVEENSDNDEGVSETYATRLLAISLLVAGTSEAFMNLPPSLEDMDVTRKLFQLRTEAVYKAAAIVASTQDFNKSRRNVSIQNKKSKGNHDDTLASDKQKQKIVIFESRSAKSRENLEKYRIMIEDVMILIGPSPSFECLLSSARQIGSKQFSPKDSDDADDFSHASISYDLHFYRFLLTKINHVIRGDISIITPGVRFDARNRGEISSIQSQYFHFAKSVAPLLLCEFVKLIPHAQYTSQVDQLDIPVARMALEGFLNAFQRISEAIPPDEYSNVIQGLLDASFDKLRSSFPKSKPILEDMLNSERESAYLSKEEKKLYCSLYPFVASRRNGFRGILCELVDSGLDEEAVLCCNFINLCVVNSSAEVRKLCVMLLSNVFTSNDSYADTFHGVLGLELQRNSKCFKSAAATFDIIINLDDLLDGTTQDIKLPKSLVNDWRNRCRVSTVTAKDLYLSEAEVESLVLGKYGDQPVGFTQPLCVSLAICSHIDHPFDSRTFDDQKAVFDCTSVFLESDNASDLANKQLENATSNILYAIDDALGDAEFLILKISPHLHISASTIAQKLLNLRLIAVSKIINICAPCAISLDNNANFAAALLKGSKRIYAIYCKILANYSKNMIDILSDEHTELCVMLGSLKDVTVKLLSTIQEKTKIGNTRKALTESKMDSHGRIAAQLVFDMEKCESILLKLAAKLKSSKRLEESSYIHEQVKVTSLYDFSIENIDVAKARSQRTTLSKSSGKKRSRKKSDKSTDENNESLKDDLSVEDLTASEEDSVAESEDDEGSKVSIDLEICSSDTGSDVDE